MRLTRRGVLKITGAAAAAKVAAPMGWQARAGEHFGRLDATAQAAMVRKGDVTPQELVEAAIARIDAVNPKLNAVVTRTYERARERLSNGLPDGPFRGVPYLLKDLNNLAGVKTTAGSRLHADRIAEESTLNASRTEEAGLVVLGKTNTPEFGLLGSTESLLLGPARNPWNLDFSPGGSSGGAAAAVASGMVPFAQASDGGGSIRIPASNCGLFGLKPSRGRIMRSEPPMPGRIDIRHCVSRSVRDSAALFAWTENHAGDAPLPLVGFIDGPSKKRLKVAFHTVNYFGDEAHPDVKQSLEATARLCEELGHTVIEARPPVDGNEFVDHFMAVWSSGPVALVRRLSDQGIDPETVLEPWTIGLAEWAQAQPEGILDEALVYFGQVEEAMDTFFKQYDVMLEPVLRTPPVKIGEQAPTVPFQTLWDRTLDYVSYTPLHNVAGTPAMSVPLSWTEGGLPIGSQFSARVGGDKTLLALAYELEEANPWAGKWPPVSAVG